MVIYLVGGLEPWNFMIFQKQLGMSSSQLLLKLHDFSEGLVGQPPTSIVIPVIPLLSHYYPIIIPLLSILKPY